MATLPSRRDSNRTQGDMIRLLAKQAVAKGHTELEFVAQFKPQYADVARKSYQEARS